MAGKTLIDKDLKDLLSKEYLSNRKTTVGFPDFTDKQYLTDDNRKYMKMYRWLRTWQIGRASCRERV